MYTRIDPSFPYRPLFRSRLRLAAVRNLRDFLAGGRIGDRKRPAALGLFPRAIDVHRSIPSVSHAGRPPFRAPGEQVQGAAGRAAPKPGDRKSVGWGKSESVLVDLGG